MPLSLLKEGSNRFELTCQAKDAQGFGKLWPQFIVYGITIRIYYKSSKPHSTGEIISPRSGAVLSDSPTFKAVANGPVHRVHFVGDYYDFDWRGEGSTTGWQNGYRYGKIQDHIGTSTRAPWGVRWDTTWIPTQSRPFRVAARIEDPNGIVYITEPITGISLSRKKTVIRYLNNKIPYDWVANYWHPKRECYTNISDDLSKAEEAKLFARVWNGKQDGEIGINGKPYANRPGQHYALTWEQIPLPLNALKPGQNQIYTKGSVKEHGMEVLWPGIEIFVRYDVPESSAEFVTFGENCRSSRSNPVLGITGQPAIGSSYLLQLSGGLPNMPSLMLWGSSNATNFGSSLPMSLDPFGAPGCKLLTSVDLATPDLSDAQGNTSLRVDVPNTPGLIGQHLFNQVVIAEPQANSSGVLLSNGARTMVGK